MFKKLEEIIEDHGKRNRQTILVALTAFIIIFLLFNAVFAILLFSGPQSKFNAFISWKPTTAQYAVALLDILMLLWWIWLFINYKLLQMRLSLVTDHMIEDYKERQMGIKEPKAWEKTESTSFQVGSKILLAMTVMIIPSTFFHLGSRAIPVIFSIGLIAYEIAALIKGKKMETFIIDIPQTYATASTSRQDKTQTYIVVGLVCGILITIATDQVVHFNNYDRIFFSLAFSGLSVASVSLVGFTKSFVSAVRVADAARQRK